MKPLCVPGDLAFLHDHGHGEPGAPSAVGPLGRPGVGPLGRHEVTNRSGVFSREQHAEPAERVPGAVLLLQLDAEPVPGAELNRDPEDELGGVGGVEGWLDGPAGQAAPGQGAGHGVMMAALTGGVLLEVGAGGGKLEGLPVRRARGQALHAQLLQDEVAVPRAARPAVRQDLEAQAGQALEAGFPFEHVGAVDRTLADDPEGPVGLRAQLGPVRAGGAGRLPDRPAAARAVPGGLVGAVEVGSLELPLGSGDLLLLAARHEHGRAGGDAAVGGVVEERVEPEELGLSDRVELVGVALGAAHGGAEPRCACGGHPVDHRVHAVLLVLGAALLVHLGVAVEAGGDPLGPGGARYEVARQLVHRELVEGEVGGDGLDDPVSPGPNGAAAVDGEAVAVGVARHVEPVPGPVLAEGRRAEELVDPGGVGRIAWIGEERCPGIGCGGQAGQVQV